MCTCICEVTKEITRLVSRRAYDSQLTQYKQTSNIGAEMLSIWCSFYGAISQWESELSLNLFQGSTKVTCFWAQFQCSTSQELNLISVWWVLKLDWFSKSTNENILEVCCQSLNIEAYTERESERLARVTHYDIMI